MFQLSDSYQSVLARTMFFPMGVKVAGRTPEWTNIDAGTPAPHAIRPGDFLELGGGVQRVTDDGAPYNAIAVDREYDEPLDSWAWLAPLSLPRIGKPRLDRIADLARCVLDRVRWVRDHVADPWSGALTGNQQPPHSASVVELPNGVRWCVRVTTAGLSKDPRYSYPLSVYGQLAVLGALLQEKCRELLKISPGRTSMVALANIATAVGHPTTWPDARLADLEAIPAELMRCGMEAQPPDEAAAVATKLRDAVGQLESLATWIPILFPREEGDVRWHVRRDEWIRPTDVGPERLTTHSWAALVALDDAIRLLGITDSHGHPAPLGRVGVWQDWSNPVFPTRHRGVAEGVLDLAREIHTWQDRLAGMNVSGANGRIEYRIPKETAAWTAFCIRRLRAVADGVAGSSVTAASVPEGGITTPAPLSPTAAGSLDEKGMFTVSDLAKRLELPAEALRKRLDRWREKHAAAGGWIENTEASSRSARYSYQFGKIRHITDEMRASGEASGERPTKKKVKQDRR